MSVPPSPVIRLNGGEPWDPRFAVFVMAGQELKIDSGISGMAQRWEGGGQFVSAAGDGPVQNAGSAVVWRAPDDPGPVALVLKAATGDGWTDEARLNIEVMAPASALQDGVLDGYRIGVYPRPAPNTPVEYETPRGFLKVGADPTPISPRFNLEDFACKQTHAGEYRYVALQPRLIPFLEAIASMVESKGFVRRGGSAVQSAGQVDSPGRPEGPITIMSGYRTPVYNQTLNTAELSRHQYGDASDIIIDTNGDGIMDDLNHDGRINGRDAMTLAAWVEDLWKTPQFAGEQGGLGIYNGNSEHGPFVHVDLRGARARWGGNGLEWNDYAVDAAGLAANRTIEYASYHKPAPARARHAKSVRHVRHVVRRRPAAEMAAK